MKIEDESPTVIVLPDEVTDEITVEEVSWKLTWWNRLCKFVFFVCQNPKWLLEWVTLLLVIRVLWTSGWDLNSILGIVKPK